MIIRISRWADVIGGPDSLPLEDERELRQYDGLRYDQDVCSNYFDSDLASLNMTGGAIEVMWDTADQHLRVVTEYWSPRSLSADELRRVVAETVGQWSDGIGEGCFDDLARERGVRIDLWPWRQDKTLRVEQIDDNAVTR